MPRSGHRMGLGAGLVIRPLLAEPARAQQHLTADTAATTAAGASFTAPADWRLTERAALRLLEPSEGDSHLAVVDVQAADAAAALAAGWAAWRASQPLLAANRPLK